MTVLNLQQVDYPDAGDAAQTDGFYSFLTATEGHNTFRHSISGSVRGYAMLSTPNSAVYPKWGIGVEAGGSGSIESSG